MSNTEKLYMDYRGRVLAVGKGNPHELNGLLGNVINLIPCIQYYKSKNKMKKWQECIDDFKIATSKISKLTGVAFPIFPEQL